MTSNTSHAELTAHWPFENDFNAVESNVPQLRNNSVELAPFGCEGSRRSACFNGRNSYLEVPAHPAFDWDKNDFSVAVWIETEEDTDVVGDLLSCFDSVSRRGWTLSVVTNSGVTSTAQPNYRQIHFGIDAGTEGTAWQDCGRPGNAVYVYSLATVNGQLYAGTFEKEADQTGHLWRYEGSGNWQHCGATPNGCSAIPSITAFNGELYCTTGRYNPHGSCLGPALNTTPGGNVYRVAADGEWHDCGVPGASDAVPEETPTTGYSSGKADLTTALTVFRGQLFATSYHRRGVYVYEGGSEWKYAGLDERLISFSVYGDNLYALVNGGPVYRYEGGEEWTYCGTPDGSTQTYSAITHQGELLVGTWPECEVLRYDGGEAWTNLGRVGYEREVMAMALYNAKIYIGTLPMANVWRLDEGTYTFVGNLDNSPDVFLRRVWSMSVFQGKLYAGTLPSGRVLCYEAGRMATHDYALPAGRHHVAAVRDGNVLRLYLDGVEVAQSPEFDFAAFDLSNQQNLKIGFGPHQYFRGAMNDLRLYRGALTPDEVELLSQDGKAHLNYATALSAVASS